MVLFENLKRGSRVQTNWNGWIVKGTVRYTGVLITKKGDWVGVELDEPVGDNSGIFKGRRYFECNARHGIFIQPRKLHLLGNWRTVSANCYRTVDKKSFIDETLFGRKTGEIPKAQSWKDPVVVSSNYLKSTKGSFSDSLTSTIDTPHRMNFHKKHLVGRRLTASKTSREEVLCNSGRTSSRSAKHVNTFIPTSPSIPNIHVPRTVLKRMVETQYFGTSRPRRNTLY